MNETFIICTPENNPHIKNSTLDKCSECGQPVWVAPSGRKLLAEHPNMKIICIPCATPKIERDSKFMPINEEQKGELREYVQEISKWN